MMMNSTKERVQELYTRLITEDNADFLISPYSSGLTAAASIIAEQNGKIMITAGAAEDDAYKTGNTSLFQLYTPGSQYLLSTVDMLKTLDPEAKIAIVHENDKFSTAVVEGLKPYLASQGFEVVLEEGYASDTTDFGPVINKIVESGATVLLGGGHYPDGSTFARQLYERKVGLKFISLLVAPADSKFSELGDAAIGVATSSQWELAATHTPEEAAALGKEWYGPTGEEFAAAYEAMTTAKNPPTMLQADTWPGLSCKKPLKTADSVDPEKVKAALEAMDIFTFYGGVKFDTSPEAHGLADRPSHGRRTMAKERGWRTGPPGDLAGRCGECVPPLYPNSSTIISASIISMQGQDAILPPCALYREMSMQQIQPVIGIPAGWHSTGICIWSGGNGLDIDLGGHECDQPVTRSHHCAGNVRNLFRFHPTRV